MEVIASLGEINDFKLNHIKVSKITRNQSGKGRQAKDDVIKIEDNVTQWVNPSESVLLLLNKIL